MRRIVQLPAPVSTAWLVIPSNTDEISFSDCIDPLLRAPALDESRRGPASRRTPASIAFDLLTRWCARWGCGSIVHELFGDRRKFLAQASFSRLLLKLRSRKIGGLGLYRPQNCLDPSWPGFFAREGRQR